MNSSRPTRTPINSSTIERRRTLFREALAVIERDYGRDITLGRVAFEIATSKRQLQRVFAEAGTSFRGCLAQVRMRRARELLRDGGMRIYEVAHSVGYRQPTQFAEAFRRHHDELPSSFRCANGNHRSRR